jgi:hypothetical protein
MRMTEEQFRQRVLAGLSQIKWLMLGALSVGAVWFHYLR